MSKKIKLELESTQFGFEIYKDKEDNLYFLDFLDQGEGGLFSMNTKLENLHTIAIRADGGYELFRDGKDMYETEKLDEVKKGWEKSGKFTLVVGVDYDCTENFVILLKEYGETERYIPKLDNKRVTWETLNQKGIKFHSSKSGKITLSLE